LHPIVPEGLWSRVPPGDLEAVLRTRFESDDSADLHGRAFPVRPYSRGGAPTP
jgi:hypothetical protein